MRNNRVTLIMLLVGIALRDAFGQGSAFTYQGQLRDGGAPASGSYDLRFVLYTNEAGGSQVGPILTNFAVVVTEGLFATRLDFGAGSFPGESRFLEIGVRTNGSASEFTLLIPRQTITATPYAITAGNLTGTVSAGQLSGTISSNNIGAGSITTVMLATGAVGSNQLAAGAVTTSALADGAMTATKVATVSNWFGLTIANPTPALEDNFGSSVAAFGSDRVLIGAYKDDTSATDSGSVYLFSIHGKLLTAITNPTPNANDYFGYSVAAVGPDRVLVGANGDDAGGSNAGMAHLFDTNGAWLAVFSSPTPTAGDEFGISVAAVGNRVLIGAWLDNTGANNAGAAYLFNTNGTWLTTFTNPTPADSDYFGISVAAVGTDRVLIGAPWDNTGANNAGAAYLFNTNGALLTTFTNPTPANTDQFGFSVAGVGTDRVLIGAFWDDTGAEDAGAAYLFDTNGALLTTFTNPAPEFNDQFGVSVAALANNRVLIGASLGDVGAPTAGAAYLFNTSGALLTAFTNPTAPAFGDFFGDSVAAVGTSRVLIGAFNDDMGAGDAGAAHVFTLESYAPAVIADGVRDHSITATDIDPVIGLWSRSDDNVFRSSGNVGIGTDSPHHRLRISGGPHWTTELWTGSLELDNSSAIGWNANDAGIRFGIGQSGGGLYFFRTRSDPGTTFQPPSYTLALNDSGNVGIGTPTALFLLHLAADSAAKPNGGSWANTSDARVKKNIRPLQGALDKITQLRGVSFEWIHPSDHANQIGRQAGFIAQDVERVFPHWVQEVPGAEQDAALAPNGRIKSLSLPFEFDALTVEALRELRAENAALKKDLAELKELVSKLAAQLNESGR